jgi:hypothetical protein
MHAPWKPPACSPAAASHMCDGVHSTTVCQERLQSMLAYCLTLTQPICFESRLQEGSPVSIRATRTKFHSSATFPCPAGAGAWQQGPNQPVYIGLLQEQMSTVGDYCWHRAVVHTGSSTTCWLLQCGCPQYDSRGSCDFSSRQHGCSQHGSGPRHAALLML